MGLSWVTATALLPGRKYKIRRPGMHTDTGEIAEFVYYNTAKERYYFAATTDSPYRIAYFWVDDRCLFNPIEEPKGSICFHNWKESTGLSETYKDCTKCGKRWEDVYK